MPNKPHIRADYRRKRSELPPVTYHLLNQQLTARFFADDQIAARLNQPGAVVHTYLPIRRQQEADTWPLIYRLWRDFPQVRTWSSITQREGHTLRHFQLTPNTYLTEDRWGIPAPSGTIEYVSGRPDLVIVPLLAVDGQGNRVGYGGGYYDRFLAQTGPNCPKIGLSFFDPTDRIDDVDETDVRLDGCVFPDRVRWFS